MSTPENVRHADWVLQQIIDKAVFGLRAQGHLPTIQQMLAECRSWDEIGAAIGWDAETARRHYEHAMRQEGWE